MTIFNYLFGKRRSQKNGRVEDIDGFAESGLDEHWTVDHEAEEDRDDDWEEEQEQDWGDDWGEY